MIGRTAAWGAIALGIGFNLPYLYLALAFEYPAILREPGPVVLAQFERGGSALVLAWWAFMLVALALAPVGIGLAVTADRLRDRPALTIIAASSAALAALAQAIGFARWVFVVPYLRALRAEGAFDLLNLYAGVGIGEHLGQLLTAWFVLAAGRLQAFDGGRWVGRLALVTGAAIAIGTGEGVALALGRSGDTFAWFTIAGFLLLAVWLIATGVAALRR